MKQLQTGEALDLLRVCYDLDDTTAGCDLIGSWEGFHATGLDITTGAILDIADIVSIKLSFIEARACSVLHTKTV
jgi:hypothetical protein